MLRKNSILPGSPHYVCTPKHLKVSYDNETASAFAGRGNVGKLALVRAGGDPAADHFVAIGELILNREVNIGKPLGTAKALAPLFKPLRPVERAPDVVV